MLRLTPAKLVRPGCFVAALKGEVLERGVHEQVPIFAADRAVAVDDRIFGQRRRQRKAEAHSAAVAVAFVHALL